MSDQAEPRWPWPGDTPAQRARRIANSALTMLIKSDPEGAELLVGQAHVFGETWFGPTIVSRDLEDEVTTVEAAQLAHVKPGTIRRWACTEHPDPTRAAAGETLLRQFKMRGRSRTYLIQDVMEAARTVSQERAGRRTDAAA